MGTIRTHYLIRRGRVLSLLSLILACTVSNSHEETIRRNQFPVEFLFGTSTSAYQTEGAILEGGRGLSNWDVFSHVPGKIETGENADTADDHYHLYLQDIDLMHSLGINAYRFSISWARILPRGRFGDVNPTGIAFYNSIIDNVLLRGIEPFVTLYHHDLPQELEDRYGGWLSPLIQEDFGYFADFCFRSFGDRVKYWSSLNEPNLYAHFAYLRGMYPPGRRSEMEPFTVLHNMLLSHARAAYLYRSRYQQKQGGSIGIVVNTEMYEPLRDEAVDREAVSRALTFYVSGVLDPLIHGDYPPEMRHHLGARLPKFSAEESKTLNGSIDFIGINHYSSLYAKDCINSPCPTGESHAFLGFVYTTGFRDGVAIGEPTPMPRFFTVPDGLEKIIEYIKTRYNNKPIFVTENGFAQLDQPGQREVLLHDNKRIEFLKGYLASLARAIRNGADVRGYFVWSLMDNFEWTKGFRMRFGLYYVDYQTLERTPKLSAKWYRDFLTPNASDEYDDILVKRSRVANWRGVEADI